MNETPSIAYRGDGRCTAFPVTFPLFEAEDVEAWVGGSRLASGFRVSGGASGGMVVFSSPPSAGIPVILRRVLVVAPPPALQSGGIIDAKALNHEFQRVTAELRQVSDDQSRAVMRSPASASAADLTLPEPAAGRALMWNTDGTGLSNSLTDLDQLSRQTIAMATAAAGSASRAEGSASAAEASLQGSTSSLATIRAAADAAVQAIAEAADRAETAAGEAVSLVQGAVDPRRAFRRLSLLGIW